MGSSLYERTELNTPIKTQGKQSIVHRNFSVEADFWGWPYLAFQCYMLHCVCFVPCNRLRKYHLNTLLKVLQRKRKKWKLKMWKANGRVSVVIETSCYQFNVGRRLALRVTMQWQGTHAISQTPIVWFSATTYCKVFSSGGMKSTEC